MDHRQKNSFLWPLFFLLLASQQISAEPAGTELFITSPHFGSVSYLSQIPASWTLVVTGSSPIQHVWINGELESEPSLESWVSLSKPLVLHQGRNSVIVIADDLKGGRTEKIFTFYYDPDPEQLKSIKNQIETTSQTLQVGLEAGYHQDSNAAHLSHHLIVSNEFSTDDTSSTIHSYQALIAFSRQQQASGLIPDGYQLDYHYFREDYENKETLSIPFQELGLQVHSLGGSLYWKHQVDAWRLRYDISSLAGNSQDQDDKDDQDHLSDSTKALFQTLKFQYLRVLTAQWSWENALYGVRKEFEQEPESSSEDSDSALSPGISSALQYELFHAAAALKGSIGVYQENAEGEQQRFLQHFIEFQYHQELPLPSIQSELKLDFSTLLRQTLYEKKPVTDEEDLTKKTHVSKNINQIETRLWYHKWVYLQLDLQKIIAQSNFKNFEFDSETWGFLFGFQWSY